MKNNFSKRSNWPQEVNALSTLLEEKKKNRIEVIDLTLSNPTECEFKYLNEFLLTPLHKTENLKYKADPRGLKEAREAVAAYYASKNISVKAQDIFLTSGTSEAYSWILQLVADPGDTVLMPVPSYPLFYFLVTLNGLEVLGYPLFYNTGWYILKSSLESKELSHAKVVITVNPNNPTGNFLKTSEIELLNRYCQDGQKAIIADEVFLDYSWNEKTPVKSMATNNDSLTFTLSGISKILGLPQMKLAWIIVSGPDLLKKEAISRLEVLADTYLSVSTPIQNALPEWFKLRDKITTQILGRVQQNRIFLEKTFKDRVLVAEGGWHSAIRLDQKTDTEDYCLRLLKDKNVLVHPDYFFDYESQEGGMVVLSLLLPNEKFKEAIGHLV